MKTLKYYFSGWWNVCSKRLKCVGEVSERKRPMNWSFNWIVNTSRLFQLNKLHMTTMWCAIQKGSTTKLVNQCRIMEKRVIVLSSTENKSAKGQGVWILWHTAIIAEPQIPIQLVPQLLASYRQHCNWPFREKPLPCHIVFSGLHIQENTKRSILILSTDQTFYDYMPTTTHAQ